MQDAKPNKTLMRQVRLQGVVRVDDGFRLNNSQMTCWLPMEEVSKARGKVFTLKDTGDSLWQIELEYGAEEMHRLNRTWKNLKYTNKGWK